MNQESAKSFLWSKEKRASLQAHLTGAWADDIWQVSGTTEQGNQVSRSLHLVLVNPAIKEEVKYALWYQLTQGEWQGQTPGVQRRLLVRIRHLVTWLNHVAPPSLPSLLERDLPFWICSLRTWLVEMGYYTTSSEKYLHSTQTYITYSRDDRHIGVLRAIYGVLVEAYDGRPEMEKDIWDLRKLGVELDLSKTTYKLNFTYIAQPWLRFLAKKYLAYNLAIYGVGDCVVKLGSIRQFSHFLEKQAPESQVADLDRSLMLRYVSFLQTQPLSVSVRNQRLTTLRTFLEICAHRLGISGLTREPLLFDDELSQEPESASREIPAEVLVQLRKHLHVLPTTILRMVTVLLELGLRINELCQLPLDCLICDDKHEWYLRFYQSKTHREQVLPLVEKEVIGAIQAQQEVVRARWGKACSYLFPSPSTPNTPYKQLTFARKLNQWAEQCQITDTNQRLYRFTSHQFRHTVGMRLINEDVPLEVVSRLLGHRSLAMTQIYARVRDQKLRTDLERVARKRKTVDYQGNAVKGDARANDSEVQMTRKGVRGQTLAVGGCARLIVLGDCNHANKCLICPMWLTSTDDLPTLKSFYDRSIRLKQRAIEKGNKIVVEQQDRIIPTLALRIKSLEETEMDGTLCVDDVLAQLRTDLAEAECGLEEAQAAGLVLATRHLERAITDMNMRIVALEVPDDRTHE